MAGRRKAKKAAPSKRSALLASLRTACLSSVSLDTLALAMPAPRDTVHYYRNGKRHVVDLETSHGL